MSSPAVNSRPADNPDNADSDKEIVPGAPPRRRATNVVAPFVPAGSRAAESIPLIPRNPEVSTPGLPRPPDAVEVRSSSGAASAPAEAGRADEDWGDEEEGEEIEWLPIEEPSSGPVSSAERAGIQQPPGGAIQDTAGSAGPAAQRRDFVHRLRTTRYSDARYLGNPHSKVVVDVVSAFGVIDMRTAVALCQCVGSVTTRYSTMRVSALERAGLIRRIPNRFYQLGRLLGRSPLIVPGDRWSLAVDAYAADAAAEAWADVASGPLIERLATAHLILERALAGWTLVRGEQWIAGLGALDRTATLGSRTHSVADALRNRLVRFKNPEHVWGLLPPTGADNPALLVGRGAIQPSHLASVLETARRVAPIEVICFRRSAQRVEKIRRLVTVKLGGRGASYVTVLPSSAGSLWKKKRKALLCHLESHPDPAAARSLVDMLLSASTGAPPLAATG